MRKRNFIIWSVVLETGIEFELVEALYNILVENKIITRRMNYVDASEILYVEVVDRINKPEKA